MFDRLVESEPAGAVRSRRKYFVVSTLVMGVLSLTAVVISIFADDYSMNASIELAELIAPVEMAAVVPEQPQPRQPMARTQQSSTLPTREIAMARVDDTHNVPTAISTTPNTHLSIPDSGRFVIGNRDTNPAGGVDTSRDGSGATGSDGHGLIIQPTASAEPDEGTPPSIKKPEPKVPRIASVLNGKAVSLPIPIYPATAKAVGAQGQVTVQVLLDQTGKVISATAVNGNPLLRPAAVEAARRARFTPTLLTGVPVKVTGVIIYNFNRG
ncbi:MAG: TonB family protein [Pyrinomonadaceae bacterium]